MALYNFDPSAYEAAFQNGQNRDRQTQQQYAQGVQGIGQGISDIAQITQQKRQQQMAQLQQGAENDRADIDTAIKVANAGGDPNAYLASRGKSHLSSQVQNLNSAPNNFQPSQPNQSQLAQPSPGPWSNPEPQGTPSTTTSGAYATQPSPMLGKAPSPLVSAHIQATGFNPDGHQVQGPANSIFPKNSNVDYGQVINNMAKGNYSDFQNLPPARQKLLQEDPRYKQLVKSQGDEPLTSVDSAAALLKLDPDHASALKKQFPNGLTDKQLGLISGGMKLDATTTEKQNQLDQKRWDQIVKDTDPYKASSRSALGVATLANQRANRAIPVLQNPNATNQDISTAIADIAGIFQGGVPTETGQHHQEYDTLASRFSNLKTLITGQPSAPAIPEVKQHLLDLISQLKQVNNQTLKDQLDYIETAQPQLVQKNQAAWQGIRKKIGVDNVPQAGTSSGATHRWNPVTGKVEVIQ